MLSSSCSMNTIMCMSIAAMMRPLYQAYLRSAGTLGHQVFEELVAIGGIASCLEVSDEPLPILCTADDSKLCFGTDVGRYLCSERGGCCWSGEGDLGDGSATDGVINGRRISSSLGVTSPMASGSSKPNIGPCGLLASSTPSSPDNNRHHIPISECSPKDDGRDQYCTIYELVEHMEHLYETVKWSSFSSATHLQPQPTTPTTTNNNITLLNTNDDDVLDGSGGDEDTRSGSSFTEDDDYDNDDDDDESGGQPYTVVPYLCVFRYSEHAPEEFMLRRCGIMRNYHVHFTFDKERTNIPQHTLTWLPLFREAASLEFSQHEPSSYSPPPTSATTHPRRPPPPRIRTIGDDFIFSGGGGDATPMMRSIGLDGLSHVTRIRHITLVSVHYY